MYTKQLIPSTVRKQGISGVQVNSNSFAFRTFKKCLGVFGLLLTNFVQVLEVKDFILEHGAPLAP